MLEQDLLRTIKKYKIKVMGRLRPYAENIHYSKNENGCQKGPARCLYCKGSICVIGKETILIVLLLREGLASHDMVDMMEDT